MPLDQLLDTGVYQVPRHEDDCFGHVQYADFRADPESCPVATPSGKFEIYCEQLPLRFKEFGLSEIDPVAHYVPARGGYEEAHACLSEKEYQDKNDLKGQNFSLQCISVHSPNRSHQLFNNVAQLREVFPHDVWINQLDAQKIGIQKGDFVVVSSKSGSLVRRAKVTSLVMPGVVILGQGAWSMLDKDGLDRGGNANTLQSSELTGEGHCTWNTTLVRIGQWTGDPLDLDYLMSFDGELEETL